MLRRAIAETLILLCLAAGCAKARVDPPPVSDAAITASVRRTLAADATSNFKRVTVATQNAVVTLSGVVELWAERARAETLAYKATGVRQVVNNLLVESAPAPR